MTAKIALRLCYMASGPVTFQLTAGNAMGWSRWLLDTTRPTRTFIFVSIDVTASAQIPRPGSRANEFLMRCNSSRNNSPKGGAEIRASDVGES